MLRPAKQPPKSSIVNIAPCGCHCSSSLYGTLSNLEVVEPQLHYSAATKMKVQSSLPYLIPRPPKLFIAASYVNPPQAVHFAFGCIYSCDEKPGRPGDEATFPNAVEYHVNSVVMATPSLSLSLSVLTPADDENHIDKHSFKAPFVCGARNLGEALRRISEGAAMIRTKGEAGTGEH